LIPKKRPWEPIIDNKEPCAAAQEQQEGRCELSLRKIQRQKQSLYDMDMKDDDVLLFLRPGGTTC
jgi:hypothetical protein